MRALILIALCMPLITQAALRSSSGGGTTPTPTNPTPVPDSPPTSWQPPFTLLLR